jgi:hypothetical protein
MDRNSGPVQMAGINTDWQAILPFEESIGLRPIEDLNPNSEVEGRDQYRRKIRFPLKASAALAGLDVSSGWVILPFASDSDSMPLSSRRSLCLPFPFQRVGLPPSG